MSLRRKMSLQIAATMVGLLLTDRRVAVGTQRIAGGLRLGAEEDITIFAWCSRQDRHLAHGAGSAGFARGGSRAGAVGGAEGLRHVSDVG